MKVPANWLREYVEIELPLEELARQLVFTSCEVDRIVRRGVPAVDGNFEHFVVGRVLEAGKHPNADKLQLTKVDVGEGEPRADRLRRLELRRRRDRRGRVARRGHAGRLRDREAQAARRGLRRDDPLRARARDRPGSRRDHAARRRARTRDATRRRAPARRRRARDRDRLQPARPDLDLRDRPRGRRADRCRRSQPMPGRIRSGRATRRSTSGSRISSAARVYLGAARSTTSSVGDSPPWLKARLLQAGMRPISNAVDVTNYVMLALGNPMHAFDYATLAEGRIVVRRARPGEKLVTLDGSARAARPRRSRDRRRRAADRDRRRDGRREHRGLGGRRPRCCSRRRTSIRSPCCGAASAITCAPRARRAGRRASTRSSPSRRCATPRNCSPSSRVRDGSAAARRRPSPRRRP